jgi:hypothetical protein
MEYFESWVLDYDGMTAVEKLNHYRNYYHADDDNTEAGVIADAINEILPEYVRMKESATAVDPMVIIKKAREVLGKKYEYITSEPAEVKYFEKDGKLELNYIEFISNGNYQDKIRVLHNGIVLFKEEGPRYILLSYAEGRWDEFLALKNPKLTETIYK